MAQNVYAIEYMGAIYAKRGEIYSSEDVLTQFVGATCMKIKKDGVSVSVNGTDAFITNFNDESYIGTGHTYIFDKDCVIAIGKYKAVT